MSDVSGDFPVQLATRLPDWSTGGLLPVCPFVVSFSKFHEHDTHDLLRTSRQHPRPTRPTRPISRDMLATSSRECHEEVAPCEISAIAQLCKFLLLDVIGQITCFQIVKYGVRRGLWKLNITVTVTDQGLLLSRQYQYYYYIYYYCQFTEILMLLTLLRETYLPVRVP